jgi:acyl-CoA synthetase (AMP-forming)/AMP-acid ligase II
MSDTIPNLLSRGHNSAPSIGAPECRPMTYDGLRSHIAQTLKTLRNLGIGRNDRVAIVLHNGPEMASAFVSVASSATTAPLNPAYRDEEFEFYLSDLNAKALIVADDDSPAVAAANRLGINVLQLSCSAKDTAGSFELVGDAVDNPSTDGGVRANDIALVLHTSGTTSRPKIVPLTHTNICTSARNISRTLSLVPEDRCLNIMPLFHIHGLIGAVLSSLAAGASVHCPPRFNALRFFGWLEEVRPTWYTAVPTMHQAILSRTARNREAIEASHLRLIRSSSASLPSQVMAELEEVFGVPVIESYGMTEAAHQMASNPLPPQARKPGSVGPPAGPEVAIFDESGNLLDQGTIGEIVIRGENVTDGYEANPQANDTAFDNGWFRTGDQGYFDEDGYLIITGRLKEIINRGGEKISPLEVDEILMDHDAVAQAVTFALPHDKLGEDVAAAIVLRDGTSLSEIELRDFVAQHLAAFKVPRTIIFLEEIPKGATGKVQRIGLAEKLSLPEPSAGTQ